MAKQLNKQKKIDHTSRALHTVKNKGARQRWWPEHLGTAFAVRQAEQHTTKLLILPCTWSDSTRQSSFSWFLKIIILPCAWSGSTRKPPFLFFKNNYFAMSLMIWHTTKLVVTATSAVRLLLCAERQNDTRR